MKVSEVIRRAIELGEGNGTLASDQLNELIPSNLGPEDIENGSLFAQRREHEDGRIMKPSPLPALLTARLSTCS